MNKYIYIYVLGSRVHGPPPKGGDLPGWAPPASGICMPCMHMHAYIDLHEYMHLHIHIYMHCVCMQAYTRMACMHLYMHAWHECIYARLMPCAPPHPHAQGEGSPHGWGPSAVYPMGLSTVHPTSHTQGGRTSPSLHPHPWREAGALDPGTYIHVFLYIHTYIYRERCMCLYVV